MGLEYITQPQVFLQPISALGGIAGFVTQPEYEFPPVTSFYTWTTSTASTATAITLDGSVTLLNFPGSFIISVGGVVQSPLTYTVNPNTRLVTFDSAVPSGVEITVTQIGTVALTATSFAGLTAANIFNTNLVNTNLTSVNAIITALNVNTLNVFQTTTFAGNISANNLRTSFNTGSAVGDYSFAEGDRTIASGQGSHAEGTNSIASGNFSHAEGQTTSALGQASHSEGMVTIAKGTTSHAEGRGTRAIGEDSHAAGERSVAAHDGSWIWRSGGNFPFSVPEVSSTRVRQFMVSAEGGVFLANNVGIGTDSIANALTVAGNISATGTIINRGTTVFGNISASGQIIGANTSSYFVLTANRSALGSVTATYFDPTIGLNLLPNKQYYIEYNLYHTKDIQTGSINYIISSNNTFTNLVASYTHHANIASPGAAAQRAGVIGQTGPVVILPTTNTPTAGQTGNTELKTTVEAGLSGNSFVLAISSAGNIIPLRGSMRKATLLN